MDRLQDAAILELAISLRQGALAIDVNFSLTAPWTCLFGASGSGKTSILRAIAGLLRPETGRIVLGGRDPQVLADRARGIWVPPHRRGVRTAAQQAWLFPGTVEENILCVMYWKDRDQWLKILLQLFRLADLGNTNVYDLSGGERQRVSLARAVAAAVSPSSARQGVGLLLLDEPFSGMDTALRNTLAVELRDYLAARRIPVLSVTHDVSEAFLLGAEVIRIVDGRVASQGPVEEVLADERLGVLSLLR